jgi:hypothetical protein
LNLDEAISVLQSDNSDCILMRVSGSVKIKLLAPDAQGKLNWMERDLVLDCAIDLANSHAGVARECAREIEASK